MTEFRLFINRDTNIQSIREISWQPVLIISEPVLLEDANIEDLLKQMNEAISKPAIYIENNKLIF